MQMKSIVFFGSYIQVLDALIRRMRVDLVVLESKRSNEEIIGLCKSKEIRYIKIQDIDELNSELKNNSQSVGVVASFGLIFKKKHIDLLESIFNFHPGCIYKNRGRHPLPNAIINGFKSMSVTVHQITDEKIDVGRFVSKVEIPIDYSVSYNENYIRLLANLDCQTEYLCDCLIKGAVPAFDINPEIGSYYKPHSHDELKKIIEAKSLIEWKK